MSPLLLLAAAVLAAEQIEMPLVLDDRLQLQLVAAEPDVVTPTGIAVDAKGRVLVIESHTHFRPAGYQGPKADRILLMDDFDPATGKARKISVFFEGTTHTMSLAVYHDGSIYVATRMEIFRLRDTDGDDKADERTSICHLDTPGNYPHNGLSGIAFDFAGNVYFGFGENLGADYKLIGSDKKELAGGGEGGNIYSCDADGKNVRRVATGFWNPFGLGFDAFGRLFAVDNDPDSRPPCRLLHIVEGGDYGFRFRNGRKGVHPFTAWNGELPGTLPMVAGTGEAPSAVLAYESDNLPEEYRGDLLVTSWGDHRIERYHLRPRGASFGAELQTVVRGNQNFRPVGLALAPDGSLVFSDWVDKSYNLHSKGRVWRLSAKKPPKASRPEETITALSSPHGPWREAAARKLSEENALKLSTSSPDSRIRSVAARKISIRRSFDDYMLSIFAANAPDELKTFNGVLEASKQAGTFDSEDERFVPVRKAIEEPRNAELRAALGQWQLVILSSDSKLESDDPFEFHAAFVSTLAMMKSQPQNLVTLRGEVLKMRENGMLEVVPNWEFENGQSYWGWALVVRHLGFDKFAGELSKSMLESADPRVQLIGLEWIVSRQDKSQKKNVEAVVASAKSRQVFEAALATLDILDRGYSGDSKSETAGEVYIAKIIENEKADEGARRFALRSLRPDHPALTTARLTALLADSSEEIRREALRTIRLRPDAMNGQQLREIAKDKKLTSRERCEAILGLSIVNESDRKLLIELAQDENTEVADEALRALRGADFGDGEREQLTALKVKLPAQGQELLARVLTREPPKDLPKHDDIGAWLKRAESGGDAQTGERIFYHPRVGGCYRCHEFEGRGFTVGPDLSTIGRSMPRERLVQSIVDPSREIAPQFSNWSILKTSGEVLTGIHIGDEVDGRMKFADQTGRVFHVHPNDIEQRKPSDQSIMPTGLADNLTAQELRDLLAFLTQPAAK